MVLVVSANLRLGLTEHPVSAQKSRAVLYSGDAIDPKEGGLNLDPTSGGVAHQTKTFQHQVTMTLQGLTEGHPVALKLGPQLTISEVEQKDNGGLTWTVENGYLTLSGLAAKEGNAQVVLTGKIESNSTDTEGMLAVEGSSFSYWWSKVEPNGSANFIPQPDEQGFGLISISVDFDLPEGYLGASVQADFPIKPHHLGAAVLKGYESMQSTISPVRVLYPPEIEGVAKKFLALAEQAKQAVDSMTPIERRPQEPYTIILAPYFACTAFEYPGLVLIDPVRNPTITPGQILDTLELLIHEYFHLYIGGILPEKSFRDLPVAEGITQLHQMRGLGKLLGNDSLRSPKALAGQYFLLDDEAPPICNELPYEEKPHQLHYLNAAGVWNALASLYPNPSAWEQALADTITKRAHQLTSTEEVYEDLIDKLTLDEKTKNLLKEGFKKWFCEGGLPSCTIEVTQEEGVVKVRAQQKTGVERTIILGGKVLTDCGTTLDIAPSNLEGALLINGQIVITGGTATWEIAIPKGKTFGAYSIGRNSLLPMQWKLEQNPEALGYLIGNDDDATVRMRAMRELVTRSTEDAALKTIVAKSMKQALQKNTPPLLLNTFLIEILKGGNELVQAVATEIAEELRERFSIPFQNPWGESSLAIEAAHAGILRENGYTYLLWADPKYATELKTTLRDPKKSIEERTLAFMGLSKSRNATEAKEAVDEFLALAKGMPAGPERDVTWNRIVTGISVLRLPWAELKPYFEMAKNSKLWHPNNMQAYIQLYASFRVNNPERNNPEAIDYLREIVIIMKENPLTNEYGGYVEAYLPALASEA